MIQRFVLALALALVVAPDAAQACAVCAGGQTEETRYAFLWTTGFLSVLPVSMIGGAVWWLRRRGRELAEREALREIGYTAPTEAHRESA